MEQKLPAGELIEWFLTEKRDLPWRGDGIVFPSPYAVWVSEVMLQQTVASVVIPYFERWMQKFPTVESLANASLEEVIKAWEGLGYYSRARHLHSAAKLIVEKYQGKLPSTLEELKTIKGIGPYTAGAILSFAFHKKAAAVDGNVMRVLARFFYIEDDICEPKTQKKLRALTEAILPGRTPWIAMEALIELGAKVCKKEPLCSLCPLQTECLGFQKGLEGTLPKKGKKIDYVSLKRFVAVIFSNGKVLVKQEEKGKVMADLYEFPYLEEEGKEVIQIRFGLSLQFHKNLKVVKHTFTRYRVSLFPTIWQALDEKEIAGYKWVPAGELSQLPFSSGHKRILSTIL